MRKKVLLCCFLPALILSFAILDKNAYSATNSSGVYIDVWVEPTHCYESHVYALYYDPVRDWQSPIICVSEGGPKYNDSPSASVDNGGNFVVAWTGTDMFGVRWKVYFRLFNPFGNPSEIFQVGYVDARKNSEDSPTVAMAPSGKFVICWLYCIISDSYDWHVFGQQFKSDGKPMCEPYRINEKALDCYEPEIKGDTTKGMLIGVTADEESINVAYRMSHREGDIKNVTHPWIDQAPKVTIEYQQKGNPGEFVSLTISPTTAGKEYQVYYCDRLQENCWLPLGEPVKASGTQVTVIDDGGVSSTPLSQVKSRFYKVAIP